MSRSQIQLENQILQNRKQIASGILHRWPEICVCRTETLAPESGKTQSPRSTRTTDLEEKQIIPKMALI